MQQGVIVGVFSGHTMPKPLAEMLLTAFPSYFSFAVYDNEAKEPHIEMQGTTEPPNVENLLQFSEVTKDKLTMMYFGKSDVPWSAKSFQPFVLAMDQNNLPQAVAFIEGDFPNYADVTSEDSDAFHMFRKTLSMKFNNVFEKYNGDLEKIWASFDGNEDLAQDLVNTCRDRCSIELLMQNKVFIFDKNDLKKEFEWGWMSNHCGYGEATFPKEEEKPVSSISEAAKNLIPKIKIPGIKTKAETREEPVLPKEPPKELLEKKTESSDLIYPPADVKKDPKRLKGWYHSMLKNASDFPKGKWRTEAPPLHISLVKPEKLPGKQPIKSLQDLPKPSENPFVKDTTTKNIPTSPPVSEKKEEKKEEVPQLSVLPMLSPEQKKKVKDSGVLDINAQKIRSPEEMKTVEENFPTFTEAYGLTGGLADILKWDYQAFKRLGAVDPDSLALACSQLAVAYIKQMEEKQVKKEEEKPAARRLIIPGIKKAM